MKKPCFIMSLCLATGLLSAAAIAESQSYTMDQYGIDLKIDVIRQPVFPQNLLMEGYTEGKVRIAFEVDHDGELRDWLAVEATHPDFVSAIARVIDSWKFSPPHINGENRSIVSTLTIDYRAKGAVLSFDIASGLATRRFNELFGFASERQSLSSVKDLDTVPQPIVAKKPIVPRELVEKYDGSKAVFTFYVDEEGQVRIPSLHSTDGNVELGMLLAAQDALVQWRFSPPTKNQRPARVKLAQEFVFKK